MLFVYLNVCLYLILKIYLILKELNLCVVVQLEKTWRQLLS